ncbi:MAG: ribose-phosphate pyrophosphokinase [Verrucomicrobia bacterium]|nr:ribose-phosphate pyrophosphokinase [Verrucomicrobiota bacterium]
MHREIKLFTGTSNRALAELISRRINVPLGAVEISRFADGEVFVRIAENVRGWDVFLVQSTVPDPNETLMELLVMIDAFRRASAERITAVIPCYGYARQDRKDQPRVPITAKLVANLIVAAGANRVLTVDLHAGQIQGFFDIPLDNLYAFPVFSEYIRALDLKDPVIVSPDVGGIKLAASYSNTMKLPVAAVDKRRLSDTEVEATGIIGNVRDRDVILVDDLVTTAGSLTEAARMVKEFGARHVYACVTHGILVGPAMSRLEASPIERLVITDTVRSNGCEKRSEFQVERLTVSDLLGQAIIRIHRNESVSSLFY